MSWAFGKFNLNANPLDNLDEQIVDDGTANNVWRLSPTRTGSFSNQLNSPNSPTAVGESTASPWNDREPNHTKIDPTLMSGPIGVTRASSPVAPKPIRTLRQLVRVAGL